MTPATRSTTLQLWLGPSVVWLALLILLAITVGSAYVHLGPLNNVINFSIAAIKAALIAVVFMNLKGSSPLLRVAAVSGLLWLIFMFTLTAGDYLSRAS
jgi:cytochrome c oxidase subunit 4